MHGAAAMFAVLIYAAAVLHAWRLVPAAPSVKGLFLLGFPTLYMMLVLVVTLQIQILRRVLKRYVWLSFAAGFGQSAVSVLTGLGVLALAAAFIYWQIAAAGAGGRYPAGVFSAYGAGIGILLAQALLVSALEREPKIREIIEA